MSYSSGYRFTSRPPNFLKSLGLKAGTLFFEIFGPEGRQAFSRPPAFAHALAEAKGGGQPFRVATQGAWPNLAFLPCLWTYYA